jgi:hypothetical protein
MMNASETIERFENFGVLDEYIVSASGKIIVIIASATDRVAFEAMNPFRGTDGYYKGGTGIDAVTSDGVPVGMTFL